MDHRRVPVTMRMRLANRIVWPVGMLVMFIVPVPMLVHHLSVPVLVLMLFGDVQIDAKRHQGARGDQAGCDRIAKHGDGQNRANERSPLKNRPRCARYRDGVRPAQTKPD